MIKVVNAIEPGSLMPGEVNVQLCGAVGHQPPRVFVAREDYYESGGNCYSGIELTRDDVASILQLFDDDYKSKVMDV